MGGGPSNLYIYMGRKDGQFELKDEYTVKIKREICDTCTNYEKVSYEIEYKNNNKTGIWTYYSYYSVTLYTGTSYENIGSYGFRYYYPDKDYILKGLDIYYTLMRPDLPVVVSFRTVKGKTFNCRYELLKDAGWDYPRNLEKYTIKGSLSSKLGGEFTKLLKPLYFVSYSKYNKDVEQVPKDPKNTLTRTYIGDKSKKFHKVGFTSNCNKMNAQLYTDRWYWSKSDRNMTGLEAIQWKLFDGVVVYYHDAEPLLIECLTGCSTKIQHVRKKKGTDFCTANVPYKTYKELEELLEKLKKEYDSDNSTYCGTGPSKVRSTPKSPDTPSTGVAITQDKSGGKDSKAQPSGGSQEVDKEKETREKEKKEASHAKESYGRTGTHRHQGPDPSPKSPEKTKEQGETPGQTQPTGHSDNRDTHSHGKRQHTTEQQPRQEAKMKEQQVQGHPSETSTRSPSPQSEDDASKSGHQVTHQEPSSGDTGKTTHGRDTHTSTDNSTQALQPGSHKTHEHIEGTGGGGVTTSEALQQDISQVEEDCDCAPIVALGTIAAAIVTGTVLGAVGNFVHKCLSLIRWLT